MRIVKLLLWIGVGYGLYELLKRFASVDEVIQRVGRPAGGVAAKPDVSRPRVEPLGEVGRPLTGPGEGTTVVTQDHRGMSTSERVGRGVVRR